MPKNRPDRTEPRKGNEVERDERGFTEQTDPNRQPQRGASRNPERGSTERENVESGELGAIDVDLEDEGLDR